jgi:hypothetical protein
MASTPATNQDTLVTLKINIEGSNRRFKLPLRDLGASTLPDKVRRGSTGMHEALSLKAGLQRPFTTPIPIYFNQEVDLTFFS